MYALIVALFALVLVALAYARLVDSDSTRAERFPFPAVKFGFGVPGSRTASSIGSPVLAIETANPGGET